MNELVLGFASQEIRATSLQGERRAIAHLRRGSRMLKTLSFYSKSLFY